MYFPVPAKHTPKMYSTWISLFLTRIPCDIVVFTTADLVDKLSALVDACAGPRRAQVRAYDFDAAVATEMPMWREQTSLDMFSYLHSPELYAVWSQKPTLLDIVMRENPYDADAFVWCDIGAFRSEEAVTTTFPNLSKLPTNGIVIGQLDEFGPDELRLDEDGLPATIFHRRPRVCGGIFGGRTEGMAAWCAATQSMRRRLSALPDADPRRFVGIDEFVLAATYATCPDSVTLVMTPVETSYVLQSYLS